MVKFKINQQLVGLICVWIFNITPDNLTNVCRACIQWLQGIRPPAIYCINFILYVYKMVYSKMAIVSLNGII